MGNEKFSKKERNMETFFSVCVLLAVFINAILKLFYAHSKTVRVGEDMQL
jgi:hypothetical protein